MTEKIESVTLPEGEVVRFAPKPKEICFNIEGKVVLRITRDAITADPSVAVDDAAKASFSVLEYMIRHDLK